MGKVKHAYFMYITSTCIPLDQWKSFMKFGMKKSHEIGTLHYKYDLEAKLALVKSTKVVSSNILNMFEAFLRLHNHFIHWSHVNPRSK